jgi:hypothetical protein
MELSQEGAMVQGSHTPQSWLQLWQSSPMAQVLSPQGSWPPPPVPLELEPPAPTPEQSQWPKAVPSALHTWMP